METPIKLGQAVDWIRKLRQAWQSIRDSRKQEYETINALIGIPQDLLDLYVDPDCQIVNPAKEWPTETWINKQPVKEALEAFLTKRSSETPGWNQMVVLGDAGMGKSALLCIVKMLHMTGFFPRKHKYVLRRISETTLKEVDAFPTKHDTVLLLDALDEDYSIEGSSSQKLLNVLHATSEFNRVILTCRTQFFPQYSEPAIPSKGLVKIGEDDSPDSPYKARVAEVLYLSYFDAPKIDAYLQKKFPKNQAKRNQAKTLVTGMGTLECRPLLLSYVDSLLEFKKPTARHFSEFDIYKALVESWLYREAASKKGVKATSQQLFSACETLATEMFLRKYVRCIQESDLLEVMQKEGCLAIIKELELKGRSLLNKYFEKGIATFLFAHFTIQEFLVVHRVLNNKQWSVDRHMQFTSFMGELLASQICNGSYDLPTAYTLNRLKENPKAINSVLSATAFEDDRFDKDRWWLPFSEKRGEHESILGFVEVPEGSFLMGEKNYTAYTKRYFIGKFPVTISQFRAFERETRDETRNHDWKKKAGENHPVVSVGFKAAVAYCDWLTTILKASDEFGELLNQQQFPTHF